MKRIPTGILIVLLALPLACGDAGRAAPPQVDEVSVEVARVRSLLRDAVAAAKTYGRAHLGHYLKMKARDLTDGGLQVRAGLSLSARGGHRAFCIEVTDDRLPAGHPWRESSAGGRLSLPTPKDRCTA
ncbi:MAG: hypothetical protein ABR575_04300 [Actinomycetota bacterium]